MDKDIKKLVQISSIVAAVLLAVIVAACVSSALLFTDRYSRVILFAALTISFLLFLILLVSMELVRACKSSKAERFGVYALRLGIGLLLPAYMYLTGLFKGDKDSLRRIYIHINNLLSKHRLQRIRPDKTLILLPHCMQNKDCSRKITEDIFNCQRCGGCRIGEIADITVRYGIKTVVAKGGTAARNIVKECKPDFIFAVACERELISGIGDVGRIPVIGVINQRPNGYCTNTSVDMMQLKKTFQELESRYEIGDQKSEDPAKAFEGFSESPRHAASSIGHKNV